MLRFAVLMLGFVMLALTNFGPRTASAADTLYAGQWLYPGQYLMSANNAYKLIMQTDGNLVLYSGSWAIWHTNTYGIPAIGVTMQTDGNLVIYKQGGGWSWQSYTGGQPYANYRLVNQTDCNQVIYRPSGSPLWATYTSDCTFAITATPFGGWWDRFGFAHPSSHHRVECEPGSSMTYATKPSCNTAWGPGDWSIDYYGPGRPVLFAFPAAAGNATARVWAIAPTCSSAGGASIAGWTVFIDIYVNGGWQGWESFGHLNNLQVSPGSTVVGGSVLGYTKNWGYSSCYQVTNDDGVHIHHEEWNLTNFACWWSYASGTYLDFNRWFGTIGRLNKTGVQQAC